MIRKFLISLLFMAMILHAGASEVSHFRPKVAVVLAGGGAKGIAHIAALKTIEEAGIPVDMVVGTSMGSIIGAMYCIGYSPDSMSTICASNDWIQLIMDNPSYGDNTLTAKKDNENYLLRMSIDQERTLSDTGLGGVIVGRNVMHFFRQVAHDIPDSVDFNDLPIPFACVATNAVTGQMKVFRSGNLPKCIRASMAIPSVFTPMKIDGEAYIDGGVVNNFPVDVARQMGADIVIGVDLVTSSDNSTLTNSAVDILLHCIDLVSMDRYRSNILACDIYMPIDVSGYTAASFTAQSIDTLMQRGLEYSKLKAPSLDSLFNELHILVPPIRTRVGEYSFATVKNVNDDSHKLNNPLANLRRNYKNGAINLGGRFDNEEYASILLGLQVNLGTRKNAILNLKGRLGQRFGITADLNTLTFGTQRIGYRYSFMHRDLCYYYHDYKAAQVTSNFHDFEMYFTQVWHKVLYRFGGRYQMHHYLDALYNTSLEIKPDLGWERYWSYFIEGEYNSLDQQYFPNSGQQLQMNVDVISDNLLEYEQSALFPIFSLQYQKVISPTSHLTFIPHLEGRVICSGKDPRPWALANVVGGFASGMQIKHQLSMAGNPILEIVPADGVCIIGLTARQRLFHSHYITLRSDVATMTNKVSTILDSESLTWGIQAGYSIKTAAGPVSLDFHWNEHTEKFNISLNAGYYF